MDGLGGASPVNFGRVLDEIPIRIQALIDTTAWRESKAADDDAKATLEQIAENYHSVKTHVEGL